MTSPSRSHPTARRSKPIARRLRGAPGRTGDVALTVARRSPLVIVPPAVAAAERGPRRSTAGAPGPPASRSPTHRDVVVRSLMTLQLLTYSPPAPPSRRRPPRFPNASAETATGTTATPGPATRRIGIAAFLAAGKPQEARAFLAWLLHASRLARPRLPVLFTLDGRPGPPEVELDGWPGYAGSRPVRIGNGAAEPTPARRLRLGARRRLAPHRRRTPALR